MSDTEPTVDADGDLQEVTARRAPKYSAFIVVGALVGFLATAIVTMQFPADPKIGLVATLAYFSLFGVSAGVALGALIAIILDRRSFTRSRPVQVEHADVGDPFDPDVEVEKP